MPKYAQLDEQSKVVGQSELKETEQPDLIEIPEFDDSLFGKTYNESTGEFE